MGRQQQSGEGFGHSLTDLMTSIAVIFILLFLVFLQNEQEEIASRKQETETNLDRLLEQLKKELNTDLNVNLEVKKDADDPLTLEIVLRDDPELLSFDLNSAEVSLKGTKFLQEFIPKLAEIICHRDTEKFIDSLIIEGHTDSTGTDDRNTYLSARRATKVLVESRQVIEMHEGAPEGTKGPLQQCFLHLSQATGRGRQEPISSGDAEDADKSRRVVVKVRVKSMEQREAVGAVAEASTGG